MAFLVGSEHRVGVLETLAERPSRPCELEESLSASRATIQRVLAGLADRGWIRKEGREYRLTAAGDLVLRAYDDLTALVEAVDGMDETLALFDAADVAVPPAVVRGATVTAATPQTPHAPIERYATALDEADVESFRGVCPIHSSVFNDVHRPLVEAGCPTELVIDEATFRTARDLAPEALSEAEESGAFTLYVHPDPVDVGVSLFDGRAFVGAYDDQGRFRACLHGADESVVEWARDLYERHRDAARLVEIA